MKRHLHFKDGSSDKFWAIDVSGTSYTVHYGRTGTKGQRKTKTFDTPTACTAAALKVIKSKLAKGYVDGDAQQPTLVAAPIRAPAPPPRSPDPTPTFAPKLAKAMTRWLCAACLVREDALHLLPHTTLVVHLRRVIRVRRFTIMDASEHSLTPKEAQIILGRTLALGAAVQLPEPGLYAADVLLGLVDPRSLEHASDEEQQDLHQALADAGIDLEARTIGGTPWTKLPVGGSYNQLEVIEGPGDSAFTIGLADALKLDPNSTLGDRIRLPNLDDLLQPLWQAMDLPESGVESWVSPSTIEILRRTLLAKAETPPELAALVPAPLHPLYADRRDVLWFPCAPEDSHRLWSRLERRSAQTGWQPVILVDGPGYDREMFTWQVGMNGLDSGEWESTSPERILEQVDEVDVQTVVSTSFHEPAADRHETMAITPAPAGRRIALVKTDARWKASAWLTLLYSAGEATPSLTVVAAVAQRWQQAHGARLMAMGPARVIWSVRPIREEAQARIVARERFCFSAEGSYNNLAQLTAETQSSRFWHTWWD